MSESNGITASLNQALNTVWSFNVIARYGETHLREPSQFFATNRPAFGTAFAMFNASTPQDAKEFSLSPSLIARFDVGESRNTLLLGTDYNRASEIAKTWGTLVGLTDFAVSEPSVPTYVVSDRIGTALSFTAKVNVDGDNRTVAIDAVEPATPAGRAASRAG